MAKIGGIFRGGHAVSKDMLHWEQLPLTISHTDQQMIFSGSVVVDWSNSSGLSENDLPPIVAFYTGFDTDTKRQFQSIAFSNDGGYTWAQYENNPIIDIDSKDFRDPKVFWYQPSGSWIMLVALSKEHRIRIYSSTNLINWAWLSDFGPAGSCEGQWECPDLFPLTVDEENTTKWVFVVSVDKGAPASGSGTQYFIGHFDGKAFYPEEQKASSTEQDVQWADYGKDFYAAVTWSDIPETDGRRLWMGWLNNWQYAAKLPTHPWRGAQSIPRKLSLRKFQQRLRLVQSPIAELTLLRRKHYSLSPRTISRGSNLLEDKKVSGRTLEVILELEPASNTNFIIDICSSDHSSISIGYRSKHERLFVYRSNAKTTELPEDFFGKWSVHLPRINGLLKLQIFIDWSSVEVFANEGEIVMSSLMFPAAGNAYLDLKVLSGEVKVHSFDAWELAGTWR